MNKYIISFFTIFLIILFGSCEPSENLDWPLGPYTIPPPRTYDAGHDLEQLRGAMCGDDYDEQNFLDLRAMGANVVRWHLSFDYSGETDLSIYEDPDVYAEWLQAEISEAETAAAACEQLGMLMVVDLVSAFPGSSWEPGCTGSPIFCSQDSRDSFILTWEQIASRFMDTECIWAFELLNEPSVPYLPGPLEEGAGEADDIWNDLFVETVEHIRAIDPDRFVIYDPIHYCNSYSYILLTPLPLDRVIYTVHMYIPYTLTYQGLYSNHTSYKYPGYIYTDGWENWILNRQWTESTIWFDKSIIRQMLQPVLDFQTNYNVPLFIGEFSCVRWAWNNSAYRYIRDCIEIFDEYNWDWTYHCFRSSHCWSPEHTTDEHNYWPSQYATDRFLLLQEAFQRNEYP